MVSTFSRGMYWHEDFIEKGIVAYNKLLFIHIRKNVIHIRCEQEHGALYFSEFISIWGGDENGTAVFQIIAVVVWMYI